MKPITLAIIALAGMVKATAVAADPSPAILTYAGTLTTKDAKTITVKQGDQVKPFTVDESTVVTGTNDERIPFKALPPGRLVVVYYTVKGTTSKANHISLNVKGPAMEKPSASPDRGSDNNPSIL